MYEKAFQKTADGCQVGGFISEGFKKRESISDAYSRRDL